MPFLFLPLNLKYPYVSVSNMIPRLLPKPVYVMLMQAYPKTTLNFTSSTLIPSFYRICLISLVRC